MAKENEEIVVIDETMIKSKIHIIRNQKVMFDFELAEIYGYSTKRFNEQVKIILKSLMMIFCFNYQRMNGKF